MHANQGNYQASGSALAWSPASLERLPGEPEQPPLRLLERPAQRTAVALPRAAAVSLAQPNWLNKLRQAARSALYQPPFFN